MKLFRRSFAVDCRVSGKATHIKRSVSVVHEHVRFLPQESGYMEGVYERSIWFVLVDDPLVQPRITAYIERDVQVSFKNWCEFRKKATEIPECICLCMPLHGYSNINFQLLLLFTFIFL